MQAEKVYVSTILGMTVEALDLDGAIVTTEGFGNNHIDFASHIEQIGQRRILVVGMTYAAVQGQLVIALSNRETSLPGAQDSTPYWHTLRR